MRKYLSIICTFCALIFASHVCLASDTCVNTAKLKDLVDSGYKYIKENGVEKAYKEFSDKNGKFVTKKHYFFVFNNQGKCLAHIDATQINKNMLPLKDRFGTKVIEMLCNIAKQGGGFAGYYWPNPNDKGKNQFKISYVKPIDSNTFIGTGEYVNE